VTTGCDTSFIQQEPGYRYNHKAPIALIDSSYKKYNMTGSNEIIKAHVSVKQPFEKFAIKKLFD
jgi:hypothetical protein